jgi:outer membrane protein/protease secretion system outer membrane protein
VGLALVLATSLSLGLLKEGASGAPARDVAAAQVSGASAGQVRIFDLAQAWELARARDPQMRTARALAERERERVPQALAQLRPQASANLQRYRNALRSEQPGPGGTTLADRRLYTSANDQLTLRQPLFRPQLAAGLRQAEALAASSEATLDSEEQQLVMRLTEAYLQVLQAEEQLRLVALQRAAYAAQLDAARKGLAAGSGTRTDIDEAQARIDLNIAQELEARQAVEFRRRQLAVIVGEPVAALAPLAVERLPLAAPPASLDAWLARAEEASPELRAATLQLQAAREDVDRARAAHLPTADAIAAIARTESDDPVRVDTRFLQRYVGVQVTIPIYQGGAVDSQVRQAQAEVQRQQGLLEAAREDLAVRVHREYRGVTEGVARVRALEQAVRSGEQVVVSSRRSHAAGSRTVLDILNAEQQLGSTRRDLAQARFAWLLSLVRLRALAGELREPSIAQVNGWLAH